MKRALSFILAVIAVFLIITPDSQKAVAADVEPRWNNLNSATVTLSINSTGKAQITIKCNGISNVTSRIKAESKLERKWGILWLDVDGGLWYDITTLSELSVAHDIQLDKKATYRVTTKFTISGSGGADDSFEKTAQYVYQ